MKAEQIYDEDFADETGRWFDSWRRQELWQNKKSRELVDGWFRWLGVDTSESNVVKIKP